MYKTVVKSFIVADFTLINKDGEVVLEGKTKSDAFQTEKGATIGGIGINSEEKEVYDEIAASFLDNFAQDLANAENL